MASSSSTTPSDAGVPSNIFLQSPLLTDAYQITMAYAYWKNKIHEKRASFELFFRKCPFGGEYAVFAGLHTVLQFLENFHFSDSDIEFLHEMMPDAEEEFFTYLRKVDASCLTVYALREGTICFPTVPLLRVEGPLAVAQLIETPLLNIVGYPTLVCTNAARMRLAAGQDKVLLEFGLRRAQGPDGGMSASLYAVMGGFDKTSNVLAGKLFGIPLSGTHAHSFVMSYRDLNDLTTRTLKRKVHPEDLPFRREDGTLAGPSPTEDGELVDFASLVLEKKALLSIDGTQEGELAAFIAYAICFPESFCALVDTYDTLRSGIPNFLCVSLALLEMGYSAGSIRLDSGDLAYLSKEARKIFIQVASTLGIPEIATILIVASNDINESTLLSLNDQKHQIDAFGIGTNLVTCQAQPSLGCVYKLVELDGAPRIKLSDEVGKTTVPSRKAGFRLFFSDGSPILDLLVRVLPDGTCDEPVAGKRILCRHPYHENKRCIVIPSRVLPLHHLVWEGHCMLVGLMELDAQLEETRDYVMQQLYAVRSDHLRSHNPTPYKISLSDDLYHFTHEKFLESSPIPILSK